MQRMTIKICLTLMALCTIVLANTTFTNNAKIEAEKYMQYLKQEALADFDYICKGDEKKNKVFH